VRGPAGVDPSLPVMKRATRRFISALWLAAKVCNTYLRAPMKVPW
jgi:predicted secreted protein